MSAPTTITDREAEALAAAYDLLRSIAPRHRAQLGTLAAAERDSQHVEHDNEQTADERTA